MFPGRGFWSSLLSSCPAILSLLLFCFPHSVSGTFGSFFKREREETEKKNNWRAGLLSSSNRYWTWKMPEDKSPLKGQTQDYGIPVSFTYKIFEKIIPVPDDEKLNAPFPDSLVPNVPKLTQVFLFKELSDHLHFVSLLANYLKRWFNAMFANVRNFSY